MDAFFLAAGLLILALALWDIFQGIVVPRPTPGHFRMARYVIPPTWRLWRAIGLRTRTGLARDAFLGLYAPAAAVLLLAMWLATMIVGYGLVLFAIRDQVVPAPHSVGEAIYFAGVSVLTLGFGEIVAVGPAARVIVLVGAATGLGIVALVITFLFSLFASYQRREVEIVKLSARAKAPPSAITLLVTHARLGLVDELPALFRGWETWEAEVLDSHVAYPLLGYFRSSHDGISWVSALGAVLDAAALVLTTIRNVPRGQAEITKRVGAHLVEDITNNLRQREDGWTNRSLVDRAAFDSAYARLGRAGYELEPIGTAWHGFERARATYAERLDALADYFATPATSWDGHRKTSSSAVHRERESSEEPAQA